MRSAPSSTPSVNASADMQKRGYWQYAEEIGRNVTLAGTLLFGGGQATDAAVPVRPQQAEKKQDAPKKPPEPALPPLTLAEIVKLRGELDHERYPHREKATSVLRKRVNLDALIYLAPLQKGPHEEGNRRVGLLLQEHYRPLVAKNFPVKLSAPGWSDGLSFHPGLGGKVFDPPPLLGEGVPMQPWMISQHYRAQAQAKGAKCSGSPDWPDYKMALDDFLDDWRNYRAADALWNPKAEKDLSAWEKQNPGGDKAEWLRKRFAKEMESVMNEVQGWGEEFVTGSEQYRKNARLPELRPKPGPEIRLWPRGTPREQMRSVLEPLLVPQNKKVRKAG